MKPSTAGRFVAMYPSAWRARYGDEFQRLLSDQRLTPLLALDVIGGAIDAHILGGRMTMKMMTRCAAGGPQVSTAEAWQGALLLLGVTVTLLGATGWLRNTFGEGPLLEAFASMAFPAAFLLLMPKLFMKGASRREKWLVVGVTMTLLVAATVVSIAL